MRKPATLATLATLLTVGAVLLGAVVASPALAADEAKGRTAEDYFRDGVEHLAAGRTDDAISAFRSCVDFKPDQKECWFNLGVAYGRLREFRREADSYLKAIGLDPNYGRAHFNLAVAFEDLGKHDRALLHYDKAIAAEPNYQPAHSNRAMLLLSQKRVDDAIKGFEAALKVKDDNADAWFDLAEAQDLKANALTEPARTKGLRAAIATYYKALQINPRHHRSHYNIGVIHHRLADFASEVAAYEKALAIQPKYMPALYNIAFAMRDKKDYGGAMAAFERYIAAAESGKAEQRFVAVARRELAALKAGQPGPTK